MYKKDEELILLGNKGKEGDSNFLPKGTLVTFIEAKDYGFQSMVVVKHGDIIMVLPELAVKPSNTNSLAVLRDFNSKLMDNNPELRRYHHNLFMRVFYGIKDFIKGLFGKKRPKAKADLSKLKDMLNEGGDVE